MHSASRRIATPSASRISRIASDTSSSSRAHQARRLLDHRDFGAEAPEHLGELEPDIAAADDDEMAGQGVELEQGGVGQRLDLIDAGKVGHDRPAADVDEESVRPRARRRRPQPWSAKRSGAWPVDDRAVRHALEPGFEMRARVPDDLVLSRHDGGEIDADRAGADAVIAGAPRHMGGIGAGDERLGRRAAGVDAGPADQLALDQRDCLAGRGEPAGHRRTGLAGADHDRRRNGGSWRRS